MKKANIILLWTDVLVFTGGLTLFHHLRLGTWIDYFSISFIGVITIVISTLYITDVYNTSRVTDRMEFALKTLYGTILAGVASTVFVYVSGPGQLASIFGRGVLPVTLLAFGLWGVASRYVISSWTLRPSKNTEWLFIGHKESLVTFLKDFNLEHGRTEDTRTGNHSQTQIRPHVSLYPGEGPIQSIKETSWSNVIISSYDVLSHNDLSRLMEYKKRGTPVYDLTSFYEIQKKSIPVVHLEKDWFLQSGGFSLLRNRTGIRFKRVTDIILSLLFMIPSIPVMAAVGLLVRATSPGPVLYSQNRIGLHGRIFRIYKFRTMQVNAEAAGAQWAGSDDPRVTGFGRFLRSSRLDELPQLWNVLKGDMSFIGPRPERPEFLHEIESEIPFYGLRHLIKPRNHRVGADPVPLRRVHRRRPAETAVRPVLHQELLDLPGFLHPDQDNQGRPVAKGAVGSRRRSLPGPAGPRGTLLPPLPGLSDMSSLPVSSVSILLMPNILIAVPQPCNLPYRLIQLPR